MKVMLYDYFHDTCGPPQLSDKQTDKLRREHVTSRHVLRSTSRRSSCGEVGDDDERERAVRY